MIGRFADASPLTRSFPIQSARVLLDVLTLVFIHFYPIHCFNSKSALRFVTDCQLSLSASTSSQVLHR
jgi:hypothetical protein